MRTRFALAAALTALAALALALAASATDPPASGDWTVSRSTTVSDRDFVLSGNLTVDPGATLTLRDLNLTMDCPADGVTGIYVMPAGMLRMTNVSVRSSEADAHYWFEVRGGAEMRGCDVRDVAANTAHSYYWSEIRGGVQLLSDDVLLEDSTFHDCQRINVYVNGCSPTISNCTFKRAEYVCTFTERGQNWQLGGTFRGYFTDATGLFLASADATVECCTFSHNGAPDSVMDLYSPQEYRNVVVTMGRGVLAYRSSPSFTNCIFESNGEQPEDRTVGAVNQYFLDFLLDHWPVEGDLVCIDEDARPKVTRCTFDGNDAYGVLGDEGGAPTIVEGCSVDGTTALWITSFCADTGGVYIRQESGPMVVANTSMAFNYVGANIYVMGTSLVLRNVTAYLNVSNVVDNIVVGPGVHEIYSCHLEASTDVLANIRVGYTGLDPQIYMDRSTMVGGQFAIRNTGSYPVHIRLVECRVWGQAECAFFVSSSRIDCVDCNLTGGIFPPSEYDYLDTFVNILYYLDVSVQWPGGTPVQGAYVRIENATGEFLGAGFSGANGSVERQPIMSRSLHKRGRVTEVDHSPLRIIATSRNFTSPVHFQDFEGNSVVTVTLPDATPPTFLLLSPTEGHLQASSTLTVRGVALDVESGLGSVDVSLNGVTWMNTSMNGPVWTATISVGDGVHYIVARAIDRAGNMAKITVENVTVDLTPPWLSIEPPERPGAPTNRTWARIVCHTEPGTKVTIGPATAAEDPAGTFTALVDLREGRNDIRIKATDRAGNALTRWVTYTRDTLPPAILLDDMLALTNRTMLHVGGVVFEAHPGTLAVNDVILVDGVLDDTVTLQEGANTITVVAIDAAGNRNVVERAVTLDTVAPTAEMASPAGDLMTNDRTLDVVGVVRGDFETVWVCGQVVEANLSSFGRSVTLAEGVNRIDVNITDAAGNGWGRTYWVTLDTRPPVITLDRDLDGTITRDGDIQLRGTVEGATVLTVGGRVVDPPGRFILSFPLDETGPRGEPNVITIIALDAVGNAARTDVRVYRDTTAPVLLLDPLPPTTRDGYVLVTGRLEEGGDVASLTADGVPLAVAENGTFHGYVPLAVGPHGVLVRVTDLAGNIDEDVLLTERLPPPGEAPEDFRGWVAPTLLIAASFLATVGVGRRLVRRARR